MIIKEIIINHNTNIINNLTERRNISFKADFLSNVFTIISYK